MHIYTLHSFCGYSSHSRTSRPGIAITGFTIDTGVEAAQGLGQKLLSKLSRAVEETPAEEWARSGLSVAVLRRAKALLQGEVGHVDRHGGGSQEARHLVGLEIVGN